MEQWLQQIRMLLFHLWRWVLVRGLLPAVHLQETTWLLPVDPPHPQPSVFFYVPWSQPLTVSLSKAPFRPQMATVTCWPIPVLAGPPGPAATMVTVRSYCYTFLELKLKPGEGSQKCSCIKVEVCRTFGVLASPFRCPPKPDNNFVIIFSCHQSWLAYLKWWFQHSPGLFHKHVQGLFLNISIKKLSDPHATMAIPWTLSLHWI